MTTPDRANQDGVSVGNGESTPTPVAHKPEVGPDVVYVVRPKEFATDDGWAQDSFWRAEDAEERMREAEDALESIKRAVHRYDEYVAEIVRLDDE